MNKERTEYRVARDLLTGLENKAQLAFPMNINAYLSNFRGLGLIDVRRDVISAAAHLYAQLEEQYRPDDNDHKIFKFDPSVSDWDFQR